MLFCISLLYLITTKLTSNNVLLFWGWCTWQHVGYFWLCAKKNYSWQVGAPDGMLVIELTLAVCKTKALPAVLSLVLLPIHLFLSASFWYFSFVIFGQIFKSFATAHFLELLYYTTGE